MKKIIMLSALIVLSAGLSGCTHYKEKKAPCGPTAGISDNPCNPIPINIAALTDMEIFS